VGEPGGPLRREHNVPGGRPGHISSGDKVKRDPISVGQAVHFAWPVFKKRYGLFAAILLTVFGAWAALEIVVIAGQQLGLGWWAAAHLAFLAFVAGIEAGVLKICLDLYDGREPAFADAFTHLALGPKFLAGQVIYLLAVAGGLALLVAPGVYLGVTYALFGFGLVTGQTDLAGSFKQSALLSAGARTRLLALFVTLLVFNVLGAGLLGLGLFVTVPLSVLIVTAIQRQLSVS
jgi:hypothetical protein